MQTPPFYLKSGQIEFLVSKEAQCSEMCAKTILPFFRKISFNKIHILSFRDFRNFLTKNFDQKFSFAPISMNFFICFRRFWENLKKIAKKKLTFFWQIKKKCKIFFLRIIWNVCKKMFIKIGAKNNWSDFDEFYFIYV